MSELIPMWMAAKLKSEGVEIEVKWFDGSGGTCWFPCYNYMWSENGKYRRKPDAAQEAEMKRRAEVEAAHKAGKKIQFLSRENEWLWVEKPAFIWDQWDYRVAPEPQIVQFTADDWQMFAGKFVRHKTSKSCGTTIVAFDGVGVSLANGFHMTYEYLLKENTFLDGTPCGKVSK